MYIGTYQLGDLIPLRVWCRDASGTPADPDDSPYVEVYSGGDVAWSKQIPIYDSANTDGYFFYRMSASSEFATGQYRAVYHWIISGTSYAAVDTFDIVAGGHSDGSGISMYFFRQPGDDYVLLQTDGGLLKRFRGPSVK